MLAKKRVSSLEFEACSLTECEITTCIKERINLFRLGETNIGTLPYLMCDYKSHKNSFRWITNAHSCIFSHITSVIDSGLSNMMLGIKEVTNTIHVDAWKFCKKKINAIWIINSSNDFLVYVRAQIFSMHTFDITTSML